MFTIFHPLDFKMYFVVVVPRVKFNLLIMAQRGFVLAKKLDKNCSDFVYFLQFVILILMQCFNDFSWPCREPGTLSTHFNSKYLNESHQQSEYAKNGWSEL